MHQFLKNSRAGVGSLILLGILLLGTACKKDTVGDDSCETCPATDLIPGTYAPEPYVLELADWMGEPIIPADNPLTKDGVALGRMLFYDPIVSSDSTMSCASCHAPDLGFTDGTAFSTGVEGRQTTRSSMPLFNLAYNPNGFFWDGRSPSMEDQALHPIMDRVELNEDWENVVRKFQRHPDYPQRFRKAFGIERTSEITKELAVKALAQFERTLISQDSRFDRVVYRNEGWLTDSEQRGKDLFYVEPSLVDHPGCSHCHGGVNFTDFSFRNNGIDSVATLNDFPDKGLGAVTGRVYDNGRFKVPSLRNIELTAPYMHDGRFATLEEVLDHYKTGGHGVENEDPNIVPFTLTGSQKQDLIAFLRTLTDTTFIKNPAYANPFN
ncbi:cytochrome-c peroxidase [Flavilitoribacter nigricans]|uniref:Cytochrome C peroxidase n=1 Tax=Flavilitoribacter nigricans (strain ATCC 23147 / DSM 23189 / NBRC 102662 / NCIMB 1420 / SS-2) TaxID=1122177 RepID=A0A2D0NB83_FLAN2|nr:cytochrome c peroxidase [Flavilitoribacter nigricans]PHN05772.1 cytochrome C peroxidase [Flavilitoribacter nigricans DSM 23189 = NBRC 102662]